MQDFDINSSKTVGTVESITGRYIVVKEDESRYELVAGDTIEEGDKVMGFDMSSSTLKIVSVDGRIFLLANNESQLFDTSLKISEFAEEEVVSLKESIDRLALLENKSLEDLEEITADNQDIFIENADLTTVSDNKTGLDIGDILNLDSNVVDGAISSALNPNNVNGLSLTWTLGTATNGYSTVAGTGLVNQDDATVDETVTLKVDSDINITGLDNG